MPDMLLKRSWWQKRFKGAGTGAAAGLAWVCFLLSVPVSGQPQHPTLPFGGLTLVEEIDCSLAPSVLYEEYPAGATSVQSLLGRQARVLANPVGGTARYFAYRIGQGKGLQAGKAYVLEVDYPEDAPRSMVICNIGEATARGFHTGLTVGDALYPPYVNNNPESLDMPLAGAWRTWRSFFHLHDRFTGVKRIRGDEPREYVPADGFWVVVVHYAHEDEPLSQGAAVSKIRLFEAPAFATYDAGLRLPPEGLPRRHLFVREEMADGAAGLAHTDPTHRGVINSLDYYEYKARLMRFLGMNTFTKDLLEFGGTQGWDTEPGGGNTWYYLAKEPWLWEGILTMLDDYDLDVMPYYEYAGSEGSASLGREKRARPLAPHLTNYTQISWAESTRADLADPDTIEDARLLLDVTMTRFKDRVNFVGAWFRARVSQMPMSFNDANFADFSAEAFGGLPFTRAQMQTVTSLYHAYKQWWFGKRKVFLEDMRDHLRAQGVNRDAEILFTGDSTEPGRSYVPSGQSNLMAEDPAAWAAAGESATLLADAVAAQRHRSALTKPRSTYSGWEWQHAVPEDDPGSYAATEGVMLTYTFNRQYTLAEQALIDEYRTPSGTAMVRHFSLNEGVTDDPPQDELVNQLLGYFVTDFERTGPHIMMPEALALAKGDPRYIGYLSSTTFNRGFPEYVRAFNKAFLALPAVPSVIRSGASSHADVVVRDYATDGYGTYIAVINTARVDRTATVTLPFRAHVTDAATGAVLTTAATSLNFSLYPFQVRALLLDKRLTNGPVAADDTVPPINEGAFVDVNVLANDTGSGTLAVSSVGEAGHGTVAIVGSQVRYTPNPGFHGADSFRYTVSNGTDTDSARVWLTVNNTAVATDLASWGLRAVNMGADETGRSRLLADGLTGEVRGFGSGVVGNYDNGHFVSRTVNGDFQAVVRIQDVDGAGDAMAGIMLRQSNDPDARMAAALADAGNGLRLVSRAARGGDAAGNAISGTGAAWLRLTRTGDLVTFERSTNGSSYTEIGWRRFPGLPPTVHLGLWAAGGDRYDGARALMQSFAVQTSTPAAFAAQGVVFAQDFSSSANYASYVDAGGAFGTLADISAETPDGGSWQIDPEGALQVQSTTTSSGNNDSGFTRTAALSPLGSVLKTSLRVGLSHVNTYSDVAILEWGNFSSVIDYGSNGPNPNSSIYARVMLRGSGTDWRLNVNGTFAGALVADGRLYALTIYLSQSGSAQSYVGPDGQTHTLAAGCGSLWVEDQLLLENWARGSNHTAPEASRFRFRCSGGLGVHIRMDDIVFENQFAAPTPPKTNTAPAAVDDAFTTPEAAPLALDVLANDADADAGPAGLHITGASTANGALEIEPGRILYTPAPGFVGTANVSYTISDGAATDTGLAQVQVTSTALANNLSGAGMTGGAIGTGAATGSRVLADGYWEVTHSGPAGTATADNARWERKSVTGDFQVEFRVRELQEKAAGGLGGVMIRESGSPGARMVKLGIGADAVARAISRAANGGSAVASLTEAQMAFPAVWLQLERLGNAIVVRASADGMAFEDLETVTLSGLAATVEAGLWATNARMAGAGFIIRPYQPELMKVDFQASSSLAAYVQELDPEPNQFNDIGAEPDGGAWSIDSGKLRIVRTTATGPTTGAGFTRSTPFVGPPAVIKVAFDVGLANVNTNSDLALIELGDFPKLSDYNDGIVSAPIHCRLSVKGRGNGKYTFRINGANASVDFFSNGSMTSAVLWANTSGSTVNITLPNGSSRPLDPNRLTLWAGGTLLFDNVVKESGLSSTSLANLRCRMAAPGITAWFDNIVVDDVPAGNVAPQAVNDTASTDEGVAVAVDVVANDLDSDGPQALALSAVGTPANGAASIVGGQVQYTPAPGFYGQDSVSYTVTDGQAQDTGLLAITVNNTAQAQDLTGEGLDGVNIGSGSSGGSRVLADGSWEVRGAGTGSVGTADSYHGEMLLVTGDFDIMVRIEELAGASGARVGLAVREGLAANSRMMAVSLGLDSVVRRSVRSTLGGSASEVTATGTWDAPGVWLRIRRQLDTVSAAVSQDGLGFQEIGSATLAGLAADLETGLWVVGGSGGISGRGVVTGFAVQPLMFSQNFDGSSVLGTYIHATDPTSAQVHHISSNWTINAGKLRLVQATGSSGFARAAQGGGAPAAIAVAFKVALRDMATTFNNLANFDLANITSVPSYGGSIPNVAMGNQLIIKGGGSGAFRFRYNNVNSATYPANGTEVAVEWYTNRSGAGIIYKTPEGDAKTLASGSADVWVDGVLLFGDAAISSVYASDTMSGFRFQYTNGQAATLDLDNLSVRELGSP